MARSTRKNPSSSSISPAYGPNRGVQYLNFGSTRRPEATGAGKRPLSEPLTVKQLCLQMLLHLCRKILLVKPEIKIGIYFFCLVFVSLVCDFFPLPRNYFARKSNIFNQYFVKLGWGWTLIVVGSYMTLTSFVICCGETKHIRRHLYRLLIATGMWYCCTTLFTYIERATGTCTGGGGKLHTPSSCLSHNFRWVAFDISGHAFLLMYSTLIMMEEAKAMRGWERIAEFIRNEQYDNDSPLKSLNESEVEYLKVSYEKYTPYIRAMFVVLAIFATLWDVMLVGTILYFHTMVQKVSGGIFAVLAWYFTYRFWFQQSSSPGPPGKGLFKYYEPKSKKPAQATSGPSRSALNQMDLR